MHRARKGFSLAACLLLSGAAIGWLIGLSVSPVVHLVVTSVLAVVGGLVSALAGLPVAESESSDPAPSTPRSGISHRRLTPVPLALFLIGLVPGASLGLTARTHEWFGADPRGLVNKWSATGLTEKEIALRLFDQMYPPTAAQKEGGKASDGGADTMSKRLTGGLYAGVSPKECDQFRAALTGADLRRAMRASRNERVRRFEEKCRDDAALKAAVEELICPPSP